MSILDGYSEHEVLSEHGGRQTIRCGDTIFKRFMDPDPLDRDRIRGRGNALATLEHPGLAKCLDVVEDDESIALKYRWVEGETLAEMIERSHRWTEGELFEFIIACCDAMIIAHHSAPPIVHRDIKPHNVVWTGDRYVIIDFDAAREFVDSVGNVSVIGTTGYAAPEQFLGRASVASDQYGIATTVVHMASHRHPTEFPLAKLRLDLSELAVSDLLKGILNKMLEPTEQDRFTDLVELRDAVKRGSALSPVQQAMEPLTAFGGIVTSSEDEDGVRFEIVPRFRATLFAVVVVLTAIFSLVSLVTFNMVGFVLAAVCGAFAYQEFKHRETTTILITDERWEIERRSLGNSRTFSGTEAPTMTVARPQFGKQLSALTESRLKVDIWAGYDRIVLQSGFLPIEAEHLVLALREAFSHLPQQDQS